MKFKLLLFLLLIFNLSNAQKTIHNYSYVVIPEQFKFQDTPGEYQLNQLTKFLFEKEGMKVFFDTEKIPDSYRLLDCAGLKLKATKKSTMFKTKVTFSLYNCYNENVFTSKEGSSRQKDFKKAYQEAMRNAFDSFLELNYSYVPAETNIQTEGEQ